MVDPEKSVEWLPPHHRDGWSPPDPLRPPKSRGLPDGPAQQHADIAVDSQSLRRDQMQSAHAPGEGHGGHRRGGSGIFAARRSQARVAQSVGSCSPISPRADTMAETKGARRSGRRFAHGDSLGRHPGGALSSNCRTLGTDR